MAALSRFFRAVFGVYALLVFASPFLVLFPLIIPLGALKATRPFAHQIVRVWGWLIIILFLMPGRYVNRKHLRGGRKGGPRVYVSNHTSFLDIPCLFTGIPGDLTILGKASLGKIPLFGLMYKVLYILVDRKTAAGRAKALSDCRKALQSGRSLILFPEGTIPTKGAPQMISFHDGAFRLAIEHQVPLVPIAMPYNWKIFPDEKRLDVRYHRWVVHALPPIETSGLTLADVDSLKVRVYQQIQEVIDRYNGISHSGTTTSEAA